MLCHRWSETPATSTILAALSNCFVVNVIANFQLKANKSYLIFRANANELCK